ncbi:hypothetical protein TVAG_148320 [Trichomonas vaginalis G3]|uniref:Anaphase-promoting complex subunit 4 WD40 domain-containing protein n=1 Tax=Trichomonas vaginalis (strain ATCC PRA-98 / G3) TaxID=412133 RepID=A2FFK0_TRIV3|nr:quinoprotein alcohol dehydrogenase-like family [Trichomonas vaginalis G3]EAX96330.1 hypothetical protein TVAG_148320 [Trichomonas vaginalis G3]KAI5496367.1 quinoprotein alcohol dehydrogenase-like family [Trichomonas vaginalis G3]|eukprot:XP_001309260.1 hypothetical protein [Trichomonas vaginalis G3]
MKYSKAVTATFTDLNGKPQCHVLNREGIIFHSVLSLLEEEKISSLSQTKTRLNVINNAISSNHKFFVSLGGGDLIVINSKSGKTVTIETGFSMITHISSDGHLIALCDNDNVVDVFGISERNVCHINLFRDFPSCICVSSVFHTVVCGTEDGTVLVYSSNDGILAHSTTIDLPLLDVSVSPTLGAIICHANDTANEKHRLIFMTIDCQQYGSVSLNKCSNMKVFKTKNLEDFVVCFHLDYGWVSVIEVSSLKVKTVPCEIFTNVLCVEYSEILSTLLITTEDGFIKSINIDI